MALQPNINQVRLQDTSVSEIISNSFLLVLFEKKPSGLAMDMETTSFTETLVRKDLVTILILVIL